MAARLKVLVLVICALGYVLAAPAQTAAAGTGVSPAPNQVTPTAPVGEVAARAAARAPGVIWSWCGVFDDSQKAVRTFERFRGDAGNGHWIRGGTSVLHCGSAAKWGYRHIEAGHQSQWEYDAWLVGVNWRNQADLAIAAALRDPDRVTYDSQNDTFCYSTLIYLVHKSDRRVVDDRHPNVVVSAGSKNIITAFPSDSDCRANR